jgi:outer membrane protein OmpA-like peptidoglycan-associated protein
MKKIILMIAAVFMALNSYSQIATENAKFFDNTYVTVMGGVNTPLALDAVFPLNPTATIAAGKMLTPVFGLEVEGTAQFGSHVFGGTNARFDGITHNAVRSTFVGLNNIVNLSNLFAGYKGAPRKFETCLILGSGWVHTFTPHASDKANNGFSVTTGLDFGFNVGKASTISIRPAILWDLTAGAGTMPLQFDKRAAQLSLGIAYTYHFKTSNGTRDFKTYDVGALLADNARLQAELDKKPKEVVKVVTVQEPVKTDAVTTVNTNDTYVFFAYDSAELSNTAKETLDKIGQNGVYCIKGYASSEGSTEYNKTLSQKRADVVKEYLETRGCKIDSAEGLGVVFGPTTGRVAIVSVK